MKICHLTSVHNRYDERIFTKECCSLQKAGYDVSLIVADDKPDEIKDGVKIYGVKSSENRLLRILQTSKNVYKKAIQLDVEIYHFHDPELIPVGIKLKRKGKKVIFDSHEDVPQQILSKKWIPTPFRKIIAYLYSRYESASLKKFDGIVSVNSNIVERLKKINPNTIVITNYPIIKNSVIQNENKYENRTICFAGTISRDYNIHKILEAIENIDNVKFVLCGIGDPLYLQELRTLPAWNKVDYKGQITFQEVSNIYNSSTLGIAIHSYTPNVGMKTGSLGFIKNFEFMAHKLPIICTDFLVWKKIIEEEQCGLCVSPYDTEDIDKAITYILDNPQKAKVMGENGHSAVTKKYNWASQEYSLINFYKQL